MQTQPTKETPTMLQYRNTKGMKHIPIEKILELKKKDLTHEQIAELLGCARVNITQRLRPYNELLQNLDRFKNHRADIFALKQSQLLNAVTERDVKSASLLQKTTAFGILYDKERLERGQSTENISVKSIVHSLSNDRDDLAKRKAALLSYLDNPDTVTDDNGTSDKGK